MKLSKQNVRALKKELKSCKVKGEMVDENILTSSLLYALRRPDNSHHNLAITIAKGILGVENEVQPPNQTLDSFLQ